MSDSHLTVLSGPSGVGKATVINEVLRQHPEVKLTISATTRDPRPGETDGVEYHFLTQDQFFEGVNRGLFLEHARYAGNYYGTLISEVDRISEGGGLSLLEIDIQGALQVREILPDTTLIFLAPPSIEDLVNRLRGRGTEAEDVVRARLVQAQVELDAATLFDHIVVNDTVTEAAEEVFRLLTVNV